MFREGDAGDVWDLTDLERSANRAALGHVFPADQPFPTDDVLARWTFVMEDPSATVLVAEAPSAGGLIASVAFDDRTLRHLAVHPDHWGRGLATEAITTALHAMDLHGTTAASLWCLEQNHRARRLYEFLGWRPERDRQPAPWPPYPTEMRYTKLIIASER